MNDNTGFEEENTWFEPVEDASVPERSRWYADLSYPQRQILIFAAMIAITLAAGIAAGAFEPTQVEESPGMERPVSTSGSPPISAKKALLKHLSQEKYLPHEDSESSALSPYGRGDGLDPKELKRRVAAKTATESKSAVPGATLRKIEASTSSGKDGKAAEGGTPENEPLIDRAEVDRAEAVARGDAAIRRHAWEEAQAHFEQASRVWDRQVDTTAWRSMRYKLAKSYYKMNKPDISVAILDDVRRYQPDWDKPLFLLGLSAKDAGLRKKAVAAFLKYLSKGGKKTGRVCPYLREAGALRGASRFVRRTCAAVK